MNAEFGEAARLVAGAGWRLPDVPLVQDWVKQAKAGDAAAFEALVRAYRAQVYRTALRLLGNREDALDAGQEVFLRLHKHLGRFDTRRELSPWLYTMTVNVCRDIARKRYRHAHRDLADADEAATAVPPQARRKVDAGVERAIMERGLRTLGEKERAAIVLRDIEGLSTKEAAEVLGTSEVTVRSQISRARVKLREYRRKALGNDDEV